MGTNVFYRTSDIKVTDNELIVGNTIYFLNQVSSKRIDSQKEKRIFAHIIFIVAALYFYPLISACGPETWLRCAAGIFLLCFDTAAVAAVRIVHRKTQYSILIKIQDSEIMLMSSYQITEILKLSDAISKAISGKTESEAGNELNHAPKQISGSFWSAITQTQKLFIYALASIIVSVFLTKIEKANPPYVLIDNKININKSLLPELGWETESTLLMMKIWKAVNTYPEADGFVLNLSLNTTNVVDQYGNPKDGPIQMGVIDLNKDEVIEISKFKNDTYFCGDEVWKAYLLFKLKQLDYSYLVAD